MSLKSPTALEAATNAQKNWKNNSKHVNESFLGKSGPYI
jgi:hypothetical protein